PFTQGLAGWAGLAPAAFETLEIKLDQPFAVVVASSVGKQPIAGSSRLLVTAVARVEPTGYRWVDGWKREVAHPGHPPLLREPVRARVYWRHKGPVTAYALDNNGARTGTVKLETRPDGVVLDLQGDTSTFHWELVAGTD